MTYLENLNVERQASLTGSKISVRFDFDVARLAANATPKLLEEMVRKEAMSILMADSKLQEKIRVLALAHLMKLAEKADSLPSPSDATDPKPGSAAPK